MNVWTASDDRLASPDDLRECVRLSGPLPPERGRRYFVGLDVGLRHDATVAAVVHGERIRGGGGEGDTGSLGLRVLLDRMEVWTPKRSGSSTVRLADVEHWLQQAAETYPRLTVVFDPWQAIGSIQKLRARGMRTREFPFSSQSVARLATTLLTLIRERALYLPDDPELLDELANIRLRETAPGVLRLDHDPDRHDDRAIALALGSLAVVDGFRARRPATAYSPVDVRIPESPAHGVEELADRFGGPGPRARVGGVP